MVAAARRARSGVAGGDACDVRGVERGLPVDRQPASASRVRPGKCPRDDHLRRRPLSAAFREARRVRVTRGIQERVRAVDAVVDYADLDPVALGARERLQLGRTDHGRARVGREVVADAGIDLLHEAEPCQRGKLRHGERDDESVEHHLVAPADSRGRDCADEPGRCDALSCREPGEIARAKRRLQRPACACRRPPRALGPARTQGGERQADDDAHPAGCLVPRNRERAGSDAGKVQLAGGAVDRDESRAGGDGRRERRRNRKETHRTAQGCAI